MASFKSKNTVERDRQDVPELISPVQRLMDVINDRRDMDVVRPAMMPEQQQRAAEWWTTKQEPMAGDERPRLEWARPERGTDERKRYWKTPYADRLCETLSRFYRLSHADQMYILDLHSQGIWWRGDDIEFMRLREKVDPAQIDKQELLKQMRSIIGGVS